MAEAFDARAVFGNLAEKERLKGHHSPEGRAIRTLSRALNGWSAGALSRLDVIVLCDQAIEDWLNSRVARTVWSRRPVGNLISQAVEDQLITAAEAERLLMLHRARVNGVVSADAEVSDALEFCIELIDKRW